MQHGFIKLASAALPIRVADCAYNASLVVEAIETAAARQVKVLTLPELTLTGASCGDLFLHAPLLNGALAALETVRAATENHPGLLVIVGLPVALGSSVYDCAAALCGGTVLGLVPRTDPERRWFSPAPQELSAVTINGESVVFGAELQFGPWALPGLSVGIELGADLALPIPPSTQLALRGATLIVNPAADAAVVGSRERRRLMVQSQSARLHAGYVSCSAGATESTQDTVCSGQQLIAENGAILVEGGPEMVVTDLDLQRLLAERRRHGFAVQPNDGAVMGYELPLSETPLERFVDPQPFIPAEAVHAARCGEILDIQVAGLCKRLAHTHSKSVVVGVSGGLDSTLALLVCALAFDRLGLDRKGIQAITMPGYGTTNRTRSNAHRLAEELGATLREIPIGQAVAVHFRDIGLPEGDRSVTYENAQARERTQVLMDVANMTGGMVIGTGDLSELALGWATYNGDHMSMYGVNGGVPKTLMRHIVGHCAETTDNETLRQTLLDILATPVSPELLPPTEGDISQKTEELVGPYELHDFFLYYIVRWGFGPAKIYRLAKHALGAQYDDATILHWLKTFCRRFFTQQFKRSCLPDGPKVGSVGFSPRGDWQMPSDAMATLWLEECERLNG